jgi:hypothetical protein
MIKSVGTKVYLDDKPNGLGRVAKADGTNVLRCSIE